MWDTVGFPSRHWRDYISVGIGDALHFYIHLFQYIHSTLLPSTTIIPVVHIKLTFPRSPQAGIWGQSSSPNVRCPSFAPESTNKTSHDHGFHLQLLATQPWTKNPLYVHRHSCRCPALRNAPYHHGRPWLASRYDRSHGNPRCSSIQLPHAYLPGLRRG